VLRSRILQVFGTIAAVTLWVAGAAVPKPTASGSPLGVFEPAPVDQAMLRVLASVAPSAHVLAAISVDVDHDGDLDLVACTTDDLLAIWVNEGNNRFVRYQPSATARLTAAPGMNRRGPQGQTPATPAREGDTAHFVLSGVARPPVAGRASMPDRSVRVGDFRESRSSRAPPRVLSL